MPAFGAGAGGRALPKDFVISFERERESQCRCTLQDGLFLLDIHGRANHISCKYLFNLYILPEMFLVVVVGCA